LPLIATMALILVIGYQLKCSIKSCCYFLRYCANLVCYYCTCNVIGISRDDPQVILHVELLFCQSIYFYFLKCEIAMLIPLFLREFSPSGLLIGALYLSDNLHQFIN